jgi:hypothetical protein
MTLDESGRRDDGFTSDYHARRDLMMEIVAETGFTTGGTPEGAYYIMAGYEDWNHPGESNDFALWLAREVGVAVVGGSHFYNTPGLGERQVRFAFAKKLETLRDAGLAQGGSLDNAIIAHDGALICKEALRFQDEPVRHKLLDTVGDLALTGVLVKAKITMTRPGHSTNIEFAGKILAEQLNKKQES